MKQLQGFVEKRIKEIKETEVVKQPVEERKTFGTTSGCVEHWFYPCYRHSQN